MLDQTVPLYVEVQDSLPYFLGVSLWLSSHEKKEKSAQLVIICRTRPGQQQQRQRSCKSASVMVSTSLSTSGPGSTQLAPPAPNNSFPLHLRPLALSMRSFLHIGIIGRQGTKPMTKYFRDLWGSHFWLLLYNGVLCVHPEPPFRCWAHADGRRPSSEEESSRTWKSLECLWLIISAAAKPLVKLRFKWTKGLTDWIWRVWFLGSSSCAATWFNWKTTTQSCNYNLVYPQKKKKWTIFCQ